MRNCKIISAFLLVFSFTISCTNINQGETSNNAYYEPESIVYSLNLLSNIMYGVDTTFQVLKESADSAIHKVLSNPSVKAKIGDWSVVWGPVIFSKDSLTLSDSCVVDNLLVLFKNNSLDNKAPNYVLATSGTNDISKFGWIDEDFDAYAMKYWPMKTEATSITEFVSTLRNRPVCTRECTGAAVSAGTSTGLINLLQMKDLDTSIWKSLHKQIETGDTLAVAGHSLGGALSPSLALVLKQYQDEWNPDQTARIIAYPTAGASPGNLDFGRYFYNQIDSINFRGKMNVLDIVPHAWQIDLLDIIPALYKSVIDPPCIMKTLVDSIGIKLDSSFGTRDVYRTLYDSGDLLTGKFHPTIKIKGLLIEDRVVADFFVYACTKKDVDYCVELPNEFRIFEKFCEEIESETDTVISKYIQISTLVGCTNDAVCARLKPFFRFLNQAGYQHTTEYTRLYGIETVAETMKAVKKQVKIDKTDVPLEQQEALFTAILNYIKSLDQPTKPEQ